MMAEVFFVMSVSLLFVRGLLACVLVLVAACASAPTPVSSHAPAGHTAFMGGGDTKHRFYDNESFFIGNQISGSPSIKIVLSEQRAYLYKGGKLAGMALISTGREGNPTATGSFSITEKDEEHKSSQYGNYFDDNGKMIQSDVDTSKDSVPPGAHYEGAKMPFFMRFNGGTGMHEGFMPGYADSHGCIRMPGWIAEEFFNTVSVGTPVTVVR